MQLWFLKIESLDEILNVLNVNINIIINYVIMFIETVMKVFWKAVCIFK